jgi:HEAT repeat protein
MLQEQGFATPANTTRDTIRYTMWPRLLFSLLIGIIAAFILTLVAVGIFVIVSPAHTWRAALALPMQSPLALLLPVGVFLVAFIVAWLLRRPMALASYLRSVHRAQEEYHKLYTPLTALTNIRKAVESYQQDGTASTVAIEEEQISLLDLIQQQDVHQLILGVPGAGKTMALRVYQYSASQSPWRLLLRHGRIPVYVPMKNYSLFLKQYAMGTGKNDMDASADEQSVTFFDFLYQSDLPGMQYLRPYVDRLAQQGRLLLLCDGLNEVDSNYLTRVSEELVGLMRSGGNLLVMTCREVDYREQPDFVQLVDEGHAARAVIYPLLPEQVHEFVERYVERQDKRWQHTAGQIIQVIDRSRLRYHCTNPMMLFTLMGIIDRIGVERGKQIDTRGRLLRESVKQMIVYEQQQAKWNRGAPAEREVIRFLSEVACAARWANDRNAIQLRVSTAATAKGGTNFAEWADELQFWLDEHPAQGPFVNEDEGSSVQPYDDLAQLLQFALNASLIEISPRGVLSFRHELIAEYFVAEYFFAASRKKPGAPVEIREAMLEQVGRWSEPVAIWAGLLNDPLALAEQFGALALSNPGYVLQALALALVCVGVLWTPPQAEVQRSVVLPPSVEEALSIAVRNRAAREELAQIFTRCAEEGGQEVYRSLLPLIMVEGIDDLLALLDQTVVPDLLFTHLQDAVDNIAYEAQVKRLTRVLGRFGGVVVERASRLSLPGPERSLRLRAAAINILGGTNDTRAVESLLSLLSDAEPVIVVRATNALIRLGPALTLSRVLQALENRTPGPFVARVHRAALTVLGRFMDEQREPRQLTLMQYQRVLESVVPVLTSNYQAEPEVQQQAREILVRQGCATTRGMHDKRWERAIEALMRYLPSQNEIAASNVMQALQEIGAPAVPLLLEQLNQGTELVRMRVVEILRIAHDPRAVPHLLRLMDDPAPSVQQQVAYALRDLGPDSIPGLIELALASPSEPVADRAAQILSGIDGEEVVEPVTEALMPIVPGRTRLLVQVLEQIHDSRSLPALIDLLQTPGIDLLLAVTVVRALRQFPQPQVIPPLLDALSDARPQLYEEAINALGQLGEVALDGLIAALDVGQETTFTQRVRRAILGMMPFPGETLIDALEWCSEAQARQIIAVLKAQGAEAAQALVAHLQDRNERVCDAVYQALNDMPGPVVVPALLDALDQPPLRRAAGTILLKYPEAAIAPLVDLLGEHERGDAAAAILPQFGAVILRPLISGLDDQRSMAREQAQRIMVALVRLYGDPEETLRAIVHLFNPSPPPRARETLLSVLTNELADVSMPALLEGLEDAYLLEDVAEACRRLARKEALQGAVLDQLVQALYVEERRRGAVIALTGIGEAAVARVGLLLTDPDQSVASAAKRILRDMGVAALPFIWAVHNDRHNPALRKAALEVFYSMRTEVIKDELVSLLISDKPDDIAMAVALLLERIYDEATQHYADRVMVSELIEYVQGHGADVTNLRIMALLLLLGEDTIVDHLIQALEDYPQHHRQLAHMFLLLGTETQQELARVFNAPMTTPELRAEIAPLLGMMTAPDSVAEYAQNVSKYGLSPVRNGLQSPQQLAISLRALGGLLASGHWDVHKLQELRAASKEGSPLHELCSVLLGWRYEAQLAKLETERQSERDTHKKEILALTARIVSEQKRAQDLEFELEEIRREHGFRGDELREVTEQRETLRDRLAQVTKERDAALERLNTTTKERDAVNARLQRELKEKNEILARHQQLIKQFSHTQTQ